jgi:hypothetical protein
VSLLDGMGKSTDPVRDVMAWADKCCDKLMGGRGEERVTMSSRSVLIRWGYVTSQVMRDLVSTFSIGPYCVSHTLCRQFAATPRLVLSRS